MTICELYDASHCMYCWVHTQAIPLRFRCAARGVDTFARHPRPRKPALPGPSGAARGGRPRRRIPERISCRILV